MSELENGAAPAVTEGTPAPVEQAAPVETTQTQETAVDIDAELSKIYDDAKAPRSEDGKFAPKDGEAAKEAETVSEGKPASEAIETAKAPSIDPPTSLPSELKAQWASVPPAMQEHIAKREAESHRAITQLGQQAKAYEPFGKLVESNRDVFQNHRRNVQPAEGISQLLEAQRQLDRDPVASIAHIAKVYGVDLSVFGNQTGEGSNQSPQVASLQSYIRNLEAKTSQLEQLVMSREEREAQATQQSLLLTVEEFLKETPVDDEIMSDVVAHIEAIKQTAPHLTQKEMMKQAYERALWSNPSRRQQLIAKERAAEDAKKAEESAKKVTEAKRAGSVNVKSSPGNVRTSKTLDDELSSTFDRMRSA